MNIIPVWCVYETTYEDGRLGILDSVYKTVNDAKLGAKGKGWYGGAGKVVLKHAIEEGDNLYILGSPDPHQFKDVAELMEKDKQERLERALSKLSEEMQLIKESIKDI